VKEIIYCENSKRERIDIYLRKCLGFSREKIKEFLNSETIAVNGKKVGPAYLLHNKDRIEIKKLLVSQLENGIEPQKGYLEILHEDEHVIVINKPSGIITHPTAGISRGTLLNYVFFHTRLAGGSYPRTGVVHRLDRETSGVIIFSKTEISYESLIQQFKNRQIGKEYLALVKGFFSPGSRNIEFTVFPDKKERTTMEVHYLRGKKTVTRIDAVEYLGSHDITLVKAKPVTGRTHQIRLALASVGYPIIGDKKYGVSSSLINRVALHSYRISFRHPCGGDSVLFTAPLPEDLSAIIKPELLAQLDKTA